MQRNHMTSGLLRGCRQVPNWASWGGRTNPYAIKWLSQGSGTDFYSKPATTHSDNTAVTLWFKATAQYANGLSFGLFGVYNTPSDVFSLDLVGSTANGNTLELFHMGTSLGTMVGIGEDWHNVTIRWISGNTELWVDGVNQITAAGVTYTGPITNHTIGVTHLPPPATPHFLDTCIVDEIAFFDAPIDPVTIYNSGVPLEYGNSYVNLIASYEVEKATGSIMPNNLFPTYYPAAPPASFAWYSISTTGIVEVTTDSLRSSDNNPLSAMATKYGDWVYGISVDSRTPLGASIDMTVVACGLMPYPAGGGFSTMGYAGAFIGNKDEPDATPHMSKATTMVSDDSTAYAAVGGSGSLTAVTAARAGMLLIPRFVKQ